MNALLLLALIQTPPVEPTYPVTLTVEGATCEGCAETIRQDLARLRGVRDTAATIVDRPKKIAAATFALTASTPVSLDLIRKSLRGYNLKTAEIEVRGAAAFKTSEQGDLTVEGSRQFFAIIHRPGDVEDKPFDEFKKAVGQIGKTVVVKGEIVVHKNDLALYVTSFKEN